MHKRLLVTFAIFVLIAADAPQDEATKKELKTFQGTWLLESAVRDGKKQDADKIKLVITGQKYALSDESSAVIGHRGTFKMDPSKKPKATEVTVTEGPDKGKTFLGIYELGGDDYKVCFAAPGKERPKEFESPAGSGQLLQVWKRAKK